MTKEELLKQLKTQDQDWYNAEYCLEAVKQDGNALRYVNKKIFGL